VANADSVMCEVLSDAEHAFGTSHAVSQAARSALARLRDHYLAQVCHAGTCTRAVARLAVAEHAWQCVHAGPAGAKHF
jgi:hypothetical protein